MVALLGNIEEFVGTRDLRKNLTKILKELQEEKETIVVTSQGKPAGVLLPVEEYVALLETIQDLHDKNLLESIAAARREIEEGKGITAREYLEKRKKREGRTSSKRVA